MFQPVGTVIANLKNRATLDENRKPKKRRKKNYFFDLRRNFYESF